MTRARDLSISNLPSQTGNSGKYLTTDGTNQSWGTISAGGMTLLSTTTLSGASTTISSISASYTHLFIAVYGLTNATSSGQLMIKPNNNASITSQVSSYIATTSSVQNDSIYFPNISRNILLTNATNGFSLNIYNYAGSQAVKSFTYGGYYYDSGNTNYYGVTGGGGISTTSAISSLVISNTGGNLSTGTVLIYGVK